MVLVLVVVVWVVVVVAGGWWVVGGGGGACVWVLAQARRRRLRCRHCAKGTCGPDIVHDDRWEVGVGDGARCLVQAVGGRADAGDRQAVRIPAELDVPAMQCDAVRCSAISRALRCELQLKVGHCVSCGGRGGGGSAQAQTLCAAGRRRDPASDLGAGGLEHRL